MNGLSKVSGVFNGTNAALRLCVGFVPRKVRLINVESGTEFSMEWNDGFIRCQGGAAEGGYLYTNGVPAPVAAAAGIVPYEGGDLMTAANQTSVDYGNGVYLGWDLKDYRADNTYGASSGAIDTWNFVTGLTGYWNVAKVASGRIGAGSRILIKEDSSGLVKEAGITAISSDGEVSAEVTLSRAIGSGKIVFLGGMYDMAPIALGKVAPAGILLNDVTMNNDDETIYFEMEA